MLTVRKLVNGSISQRLVKDTDAPYKDKQLEFTSANSTAPTGNVVLNVVTLGEPTETRDTENNQCAIKSEVQIKAMYKKDMRSTHTSEAYELSNHATDVMLELGYDFYYGPQDISDDVNTIIVSRYRRTVGAGEIENFQLKAK